ncbi:MAG: hypothetical protein ABIR46_01425 [Candidatus Saccharimonadales bacterium]
MSNPEILSTEAQADPDGSIFLSQPRTEVLEINRRLNGLYLSRGLEGDLDPDVKGELATQLRSQKARLAEIALRST